MNFFQSFSKASVKKVGSLHGKDFGCLPPSTLTYCSSFSRNKKIEEMIISFLIYSFLSKSSIIHLSPIFNILSSSAELKNFKLYMQWFPVYWLLLSYRWLKYSASVFIFFYKYHQFSRYWLLLNNVLCFIKWATLEFRLELITRCCWQI